MLALFKTLVPRQCAASQESIVPRMLLERPLSQSHVPPPFQLGQLNGHDVYEISILELQHSFAKGYFSCTDYVRFCLERIQTIDYYLESVLEVNPEAIETAKLLDDERKRDHVRGPLHGIPVLVKDNTATKDKMQTTSGSWALLGSIVPRDAHVVTQLREAGAVILGHANMAEWASLRSKKYSGAYSPRRGETRNPFDLDKSPYGSSGGSAAAVSANIVPLSYGTETDSSIIGPAIVNGVVGIKPTVGLTSRSGIIPISKHMDSVGTFGRCVYDAVLGLNAITKPDDRDEATLNPSRVCEADYTTFISNKSVLNGARFGLPWKRCWEFVSKDQMTIAQKVLDAIEQAGAQIIRTEFPSAEERIPEDGEWDWEFGEPDKSEFTVVKVDAYNGINSYLAECSGSAVKSIKHVIQYNIENSGTEGANPGDHPAFPSGQDNLHEICATKGIESETYQKALRYIHTKSREEGIDGALRYPECRLDALLLCDQKGVGQQMAAQAGYPIISIPIGLDSDKLPIALSLQHSQWKEGELIKWASAIEDLLHGIFGWRATPGYCNPLSKRLPVFE